MNKSPSGKTGAVQFVVARLRQDVATLGDDRCLAPDLAATASLIGSGDLALATGLNRPTLWGLNELSPQPARRLSRHWHHNHFQVMNDRSTDADAYEQLAS